MNAPTLARAVAAATEVASALGLAAAETRLLNNSNKLALRLLPCDTVARVAFEERDLFEMELEVGRRLAEAEAPVARLDPRVEPRVHERDGFVVTLWSYYEQSQRDLSPGDYATALARLHDAMAAVEVAVPHFTDRVAEARRLVASRSRTPELGDPDRELLGRTLRESSRRIRTGSAAEQLLHGEPHPGNVLDTDAGPLFIDFETCCRGPVEFDLAHMPEAVGDRYPGVDRDLLGECRLLVVAMVAAWRWDAADDFPGGKHERHALLDALRAGA